MNQSKINKVKTITIITSNTSIVSTKCQVHVGNTLNSLTHSVLISSLQRMSYYYAHFKNDETKTQKRVLIFPVAHR